MPKPNPYKLGDPVLASRAQDGADHEEARVVDVYSLLMSGEEHPMVVVEFPDEKRAWLNADGPDVMPIVQEEATVEADGELGGDEDDG